MPSRDAFRRFAWLAFAGVLLHGNWEWLQTPFYEESAPLLVIVWYRLHCTIIDAAILLGSAAAVAVARRSLAWLARPGWRDLMLIAAFGVGYTAVSEHLNVSVNAVWSYSELMPLVPGTGIGLVPLLQWALLAPLAVVLAARLAGPLTSARSGRGARAGR